MNWAILTEWRWPSFWWADYFKNKIKLFRVRFTRHLSSSDFESEDEDLNNMPKKMLKTDYLWKSSDLNPTIQNFDDNNSGCKLPIWMSAAPSWIISRIFLQNVVQYIADQTNFKAKFYIWKYRIIGKFCSKSLEHWSQILKKIKTNAYDFRHCNYPNVVAVKIIKIIRTTLIIFSPELGVRCTWSCIKKYSSYLQNKTINNWLRLIFLRS